MGVNAAPSIRSGAIDRDMDRCVHGRLGIGRNRSTKKVNQNRVLGPHAVVLDTRRSDHACVGTWLPGAQVAGRASNQSSGDHLAGKTDELAPELTLRHANLLSAQGL